MDSITTNLLTLLFQIRKDFKITITKKLITLKKLGLKKRITKVFGKVQFSLKDTSLEMTNLYF